MGATVSALTPEQKGALTKRLEEAYKQLSADGLEDDIVKDSMLSEYNAILKKLQTPTTTTSKPVLDTATTDHAKPEASKTVTLKPTAEPHVEKQLSRSSSKTNLKKQKATKYSRRRSFDTASRYDTHKSHIVAAAAEVAAKLSSTPEDVVDSWDSVTYQPFCTVCQMAFKSQDFLDRHIKFSDLHAKILQETKKKDGKVDAPVPKTPVTAVPPTISTEEINQVEGVHYKRFYTGSKFFWRTQISIDVDIYLHLLPYVIEVISFDPANNREANRVYLDYTIIKSTLERLVAGDLDSKFKEEAQHEEEGSVIRERLLLQRVITYILQRLQLDTTTGNMNYIEVCGDSDLLSPLLGSPPAALVPVPLPRRRRTSAAEFESQLQSISVDHTAIDKAIDLAASYEHAAEPAGHPTGTTHG